jgi:hypothetical protein
MKVDSAPLMKSANNSDIEIIDAENYEVITPSNNNKIKNIRYIPIESEEPIGDIYQLMVFDERIYILDIQTEKIFIFTSGGKKIGIIDDRGGGPQEYIGLGTMCISKEDSCLIVHDRLALNLLYYSLDGNFIKKEKGIAGCFIESYKDKIIYQLAFRQSFSDDINSNFHIVSAVRDSVINKAFPLYPIHKDAIAVKSLSYNSQGTLLCAPLYSDTVYEFVDDSVFARKYIIKQKKSLWNRYEDELSIEKKWSLISNDKYTCLDKPFLETDNFIAYSIKTSVSDANRISHLVSNTYFFDKNNKKSYYFAAEQISESLPDYIPSPKSIYNNYFVGYMPSHTISDVREWIKGHELRFKNESFRELIYSKTDWECVVILYELE